MRSCPIPPALDVTSAHVRNSDVPVERQGKQSTQAMHSPASKMLTPRFKDEFDTTTRLVPSAPFAVYPLQRAISIQKLYGSCFTAIPKSAKTTSQKLHGSCFTAIWCISNIYNPKSCTWLLSSTRA